MIPAPLNVEKELAGYYQICFGEPVPNVPAVMARETRQAFYAGVAVMQDWLTAWATSMDDENERVFQHQLVMLQEQIVRFARDVRP